MPYDSGQGFLAKVLDFDGQICASASVQRQDILRTANPFEVQNLNRFILISNMLGIRIVQLEENACDIAIQSTLLRVHYVQLNMVWIKSNL